MDLVITMLNGQSCSLTVQPETTVGSLKALISQRFNVPTSMQRLSYENGQKISLNDDARSLSSYRLQSGSRVCVLITEPRPMQVFLKNEKGQTHTYDITPDETVTEFKQKVQNKEKVPVNQQRLVHEGKQMEDGYKLKDYGVRAESTIFLTLRLRGG